MIDTTDLSIFVAQQFPEFYQQQGSEFILFVQAYYEWLNQTGQIINQGRNLPNYVDIDLTADEYLSHFKNAYMNDLPAEIVGNQRLFQKHILELYRSKGSVAGLKLLFRLLYNEDVDLYIPSYDIFKGSDGEWKRPMYVEVTPSTDISDYQGKIITGISSGATAMVESAVVKQLTGGTSTVLYLSQ
jgi:hypothetical protein